MEDDPALELTMADDDDAPTESTMLKGLISDASGLWASGLGSAALRFLSDALPAPSAAASLPVAIMASIFLARQAGT